MEACDIVDCTPIFFRLPPRNIVQIKNILETYDGMTGELRTLNAERGEIVIFAMPDTEENVRKLVSSLSEELEIREVEPPEELAGGDWLLDSYLVEMKLKGS